MDNAVALASIGLVGTLLAVVVKPLFTLLRENTKATNALVEETKKGNREAKQRNGHLAELVIQQGEQTKMIAEASTEKVIAAMQHVEHQKVEHQIVNDIQEVKSDKEK